MDKGTTIQELKDKVKKFCDDRDWDQFHPAKDLAIGILTEASELIALFRFKSDAEVQKTFSVKEKKKQIEDEVADVFYFLLRFAQKYDVDLAKSLKIKLSKNEKKYPIEKSRGSNKKYNEA